MPGFYREGRIRMNCHFTPHSAIRSPETGHTAGGWGTPFAVITGYPTAGEIPAPHDALEVEHGPSGSDWPSIPKAGTNGEQRRTRRRDAPSRAATVRRRTHVTTVVSKSRLRRVAGPGPKRARTGVGDVWVVGHASQTVPAERADLPQRKTGNRNGVTARALSRLVDAVSRRPGHMCPCGGIAEEAKAWGNAQETLTSARGWGWYGCQ